MKVVALLLALAFVMPAHADTAVTTATVKAPIILETDDGSGDSDRSGRSTSTIILRYIGVILAASGAVLVVNRKESGAAYIGGGIALLAFSIDLE